MKAGWMTLPLACFAAFTFLFVVGSSGAGPAPDSDGDGTVNAIDNCAGLANFSQTDTDEDGLGNACDADYNNDNTVSVADFNILRSAFSSVLGDVNYNALVDSNDDNAISIADFNLLRSQFSGPPGPGGRGCETAIVGGPTGENCPPPNLPL